MLSRRKKAFEKYLQKAKENTECRGLDLLSYLIMPVQRLPRYVLLLSELRKNTSLKHADYKNIDKAVGGLEEVAGLFFFLSFFFLSSFLFPPFF